MTTTKRKLQIEVSGDWYTDEIRNAWERGAFETVFVLGDMFQSQDDLFNIINGKAKLVGINEFALEQDDWTPPYPEASMEFIYGMARKGMGIVDEEEDYDDWKQPASASYGDWKYGRVGLTDDEIAMEEYLLSTTDGDYDPQPADPPSSERGIVTTDGTFYPCDWAEHRDLATFLNDECVETNGAIVIQRSRNQEVGHGFSWTFEGDSPSEAALATAWKHADAWSYEPEEIWS